MNTSTGLYYILRVSNYLLFVYYITASDLLEMSVFSKGKTSTGQNVTILCFVQQDGTIRVLELISDATSSILEPLVMSNEGTALFAFFALN